MQKRPNDSDKTADDEKADDKRIKDSAKEGGKTTKQPTSYDGGDAT